MENKNFNYNGFKTNGIAALLLTLTALFGGMAMVVIGIIEISEEINPVLGGWLIGAGMATVIISLICCGGFMLLEPNEARAILFFGTYRGTFYDTGYWWINPFTSAKKVSVRARNLNVDPIKVNDKTGNPILIGQVLVWRINPDNVYKAVFEIDSTSGASENIPASTTLMKNLENFVSVQSDAALRQVAGSYAYDNNGTADDELTLRSNADEINEELEKKLNERLSIAGIEIIEARINYLAYAPEIAAVMLRRQQADAVIAAREKIVEGAVSMVHMALDRLGKDGIVELDEERKAAMVTNLLVVLCADESAQPVINAGTMYH